MLKKLLIITPLALIAVTAAALAYVSFANLAPLALKLARSNYNIDIQAENPVLHLFPNLAFTAKNVTIPNLNGEDGALITAKQMDASVGWSAFPRFWAAPQLQDIILTDATMAFEQDGQVVERQVKAGDSYARPKGAEHDVFNPGPGPLSFIEIELKD